jgi:hypothetical protein
MQQKTNIFYLLPPSLPATALWIRVMRRTTHFSGKVLKLNGGLDWITGSKHNIVAGLQEKHVTLNTYVPYVCNL